MNLEYLARVVFDAEPDGSAVAFPDSLVGTDSHTTMVNGLGVFGWGVGGIEAEAAMLGQPLSMLIPDVVGFKLHGRLPEGATATDLVLTVTEMLRKKGVVGQFVEFYGTGLSSLDAARPRHDRQHGAGIWRDDGLLPRGRGDAGLSALHRTQRRARGAGGSLHQGARDFSAPTQTPDPIFTDTLELDLAKVEPTLAGPKRPQDRVPLRASERRRSRSPWKARREARRA